MYKLDRLIFANGERYPVLMGNDGMPHFLATLWVTTKLRSSLSVNTISNRLGALKWFLQWEENKHRDLFSEFQKGKFLSDTDIDNIREHLSHDISHFKGLAKSKKTRDKVIDLFNTPRLISVTPTVGRNNIYNRVTAIASYLDFIARVAVQNCNSTKLLTEINSMNKRILAVRPKGKGKNVLDKLDGKDLPDGLIEEFMAVAQFDHPKNPFKHASTKKRNHLMFLLLKELGIRRGELLSLSIESNFLMLHGPQKFIWVKRHHDDIYDPRKNQPVAKTKERMLRIRDETAALIDDYIINIRAKTPNANKHPYLFVTHRKGKTQGQPISTSTFDSIIVPTMKSVDERFKSIHPHYFRHNWNQWFSEIIDKNNDLSKDPNSNRNFISSSEEAKSRMYQMGHTSESSAKPYVERHIRNKTNKLVLEEQEELQRLIIESQKNRGYE